MVSLHSFVAVFFFVVAGSPHPPRQTILHLGANPSPIIVGDSPGNEVAITVTGLKPNHFYNIRVVAVAPNNFQSASPVIRLRTFGKDGKPQLGNARLPTSFSPDQHRRGSADDGNDSDSLSGAIPSLEAAPVLDGTISVVRDTNGSLTSQRRNTVGRRHSPSVASTDRPHFKYGLEEPELSLDELNKRFETIRKEIEDTLAQYAKDETESKLQEDELKREKERKRQALKEKEEQTAQLKALVRTTMEQMRAAEKERAKKEQGLKDQEAKKTKVKESIAKLELEIDRMKNERKKFEAQKNDLLQKRDKEVRSLDEANRELQDKCSELESELKEKGKQLQDLKATRELLPGADDEQWKEEDERMAQEWDANRRSIHSRLVSELKLAHQLDQQIQSLTDQVAVALQQQQLYFQQAGAALDYDSSAPAPQKRLSANAASLRERGTPSPHPLPTSDGSYPPPASYVHAPFPPRLFMDDPDPTEEPHAEAEFKIASGSLSPLAQTLLPSNIFDELEDQDDDDAMAEPYIRDSIGITEDDPQSPASSSPSYQAFASPHGSNHNLPYSPYGDASDRNSPNLRQAPNSPPGNTHRLSSLLSTFQRSRGTKQLEEGPPIGSLKPGQSQSFPRGTEEGEGEPRRRINFPWVGRSSTGPEGTIGGHFSRSGKRPNPIKPPNGADRDPNGSRPASIASSDMPRPSTDSGSIWWQPGDGPPPNNRLWQANDGRWPSRNNSRRPSIHGTGTGLTTTLASADDVILDEYDLRNPHTSASQIGVIGSGHPAAARFMNPRLNPSAPTFMGNFFRKDRSRSRDAGPSLGLPNPDDLPSESRISRDGQSIHTQTSVSESHESLMLDGSLSNAMSDSLSGSLPKDQENKVKKLFRKGSSSKFSLSSRLGKDSGLFKKGPGSTTNSADQRSSIGDYDYVGDEALYAEYGQSYDSAVSGPTLGPKASKDGQSRIGSWRFSKKKKAKDVPAKESFEADRATGDE